MNNYISVVKHTNCHGRNNNGKPVTKYSGTIKIENKTRTFHWLKKIEAIEMVNKGLPLIIDTIYMCL